MSKYRSSQDFAAEYGSNLQGIGRSIDNYLHVKVESTRGTFVPPSVGTQGSSVSAAAPSTDITASSNRNGRINVAGFGVVAFALTTVVGLNTGVLIAAALETAINTALSAAGSDERVWCAYTSSLYRVFSQKTGTSSTVVITNGASLDLMTELKLGIANSGVETAGTAGGDFLFQTKAGLKVNQPFEPSEHKTGRQASGIVRKKKVAEGDVEGYINIPSTGDVSVDTPLSLILEAILGKKTVVGTTDSIQFDATQAPTKYMSILQGNNAFGRAFNGAYPKMVTLSFPGTGEAKMTIPMKAQDGKYASVAQVAGAVVASATVTLNTNESKRFDTGSRVMVVNADGRTIVAGADGALTVSSRTDGSDQIVLSTTISVEDDGFIVPWLPHTLDQAGTDRPVEGLNGSVSFDGGSTAVEEIRSVEIMFDPKVTDFDDFYGADGNRGRVAADRAEITCKVEMLMSNSQARRIIETGEFTTYALRLVHGVSTENRLQIDLPKVYFQRPDVEIPDTGPVVMTLEGRAVQTQTGLLDAIAIKYVSA